MVHIGYTYGPIFVCMPFISAFDHVLYNGCGWTISLLRPLPLLLVHVESYELVFPLMINFRPKDEGQCDVLDACDRNGCVSNIGDC